MLSGQASGVSISTIAAFSTGFGLRFLYCTMHPSGSRSFGKIIPPVRRSRGTEISNIYWNPPCSFEPETLVCYCRPRKSSVPGRVQKGSTFMVGCQHCMAHGVVSKDEELGSISGMERLTNQHSWLFQHKTGFPVPAQSDYRNILSSLNST
jgi:hypothetical protein